MEINGLMKNVNHYASNKFNLFTPIDINKGYKKAHIVTARPISSTNSSGPYTFEFGATPDKFTRFYIFIKNLRDWCTMFYGRYAIQEPHH